MIKAIIFDCFGVLVGRGFNETYRMAGGDPVKDSKFIEDILGQANLGLISQTEFRDAVAKQLGIPIDQYMATVNKAEQINERLLEYIVELKHNYKIALLSNANNGVVEHKLGPDKLSEYFDTVVVSAEVGAVKPDSRIYEITIERLGVKMSECVFVDDRKGYCEAAEQLGIRTILYKDFAQMKRDLEQVLAA